MSPAPRILVLDLNEGHPNVGVAALVRLVAEAGLDPMVRDVRDGGGFPSAAACIVSGGPADPILDADWAQRLLDWLPCWERPILGICLGHQLMARARGLGLRRLDRPRLGIYPVALREAGRRDPLLRRLDAAALCFESRGWAVTAELAAGILAGEEDDALAVRFGPDAFGVAFHPEAAPDAVAAYLAARGEPAGGGERVWAGLLSVHRTVVPGFLAEVAG